MTIAEIAKYIDHSILQPTFTDIDLENHCKIAQKYSTAAVCVKPYHTAMAANFLQNSDVIICAVMGFPHGNSTIEMKTIETLEVIKNGAAEVDMVVNAGKVLQADWSYVENEIRTINKACSDHGAILKVIFETDFLTSDEDIIRLCEICTKYDVAYVKTSTGYGFVKQDNGDYNYKGATDHVLSLMKNNIGTNVKIKAAGGVRTLDQILHVIDLGVSRVGASATATILEEAKNRGFL